MNMLVKLDEFEEKLNLRLCIFPFTTALLRATASIKALFNVFLCPGNM